MGVQMANIYGISMAVSDMISKRKVANLFADPSFQQVMSIVEDNMGRTSAFSRLGTYRRIREGQGVGGRSTREAVVSAVNDLKKRGYSTNEIEGALHYHELLLEGIWNTRGANSARFLD